MAEEGVTRKAGAPVSPAAAALRDAAKPEVSKDVSRGVEGTSRGLLTRAAEEDVMVDIEANDDAVEVKDDSNAEAASLLLLMMFSSLFWFDASSIVEVAGRRGWICNATVGD